MTITRIAHLAALLTRRPDLRDITPHTIVAEAVTANA